MILSFTAPRAPCTCAPTSHASRRQIARYERRTPAERLAGAHFSRAKALNGGEPNGYWSARQWEALLAEYHHCCAYCCSGSRDDLVPDHRQSLVSGGRNCIANILPACPHCNCQKGAKSEEEYRRWARHQASKEVKVA